MPLSPSNFCKSVPLTFTLISPPQIRSLDWYDHLSVILASACQVVHYLNVEACSVIVHCSDGWDRTPQLVALAELILDPYYRTIKGTPILQHSCHWLKNARSALCLFRCLTPVP